MADAIDQTTPTVGPVDEVDTNDVDESQAEQALDDDTSWDDGIDDGSEDETEDEAATESTDETDEESTEDVEDTAEEEPEAEESTDEVTDDTTETEAEAERKRHNDEMAKARIEAKKARDEADAIRKAAEESKIEQYLKEAEHDEDELKSRQADVREYRLKEQQAELNARTLQTDVMRAATEIDLFKNGTEAVKNRLYRALDQFEAAHVVKDERGRPVEIKGDVYQYLQAEADSIKELLGDGARQQVKAKAKQNSKTMTPPVKTPSKPKVDPDLAAFDEVAGW